jgi:hypothetical protein
MRRWYRDPSLPLPRTEVTRFPHGVLEVKLSLPEGQKAPEWVQDLLDSGYLTEVCPCAAQFPSRPFAATVRMATWVWALPWEIGLSLRQSQREPRWARGLLDPSGCRAGCVVPDHVCEPQVGPACGRARQRGRTVSAAGGRSCFCSWCQAGAEMLTGLQRHRTSFGICVHCQGS